MDVNVCNDLIKEDGNYDEDIDKYQPEHADMFATAQDFPKIQNWNAGKYILVGVGAEPTSKIFHEFRVYNSSTKKLIGTFHRQFHEDMEGLLLEAEFHKEDPDTLIFLMLEDQTTKIVEAEILHNRAECVTTIICEDLEHLRIAEDLTAVYFIRRFNSGYVLDTIEYGKDKDVSANPNKYLKFLGIDVEKTAILNDSLVIYYDKNEDSSMISVFTGKEEMLTIEPSFQNAVIDSFSFIEKTGELLCFLEEYVESKCFFWKVSPERNKEDQKITIDEDTYTSFSYPYYFTVKGCHELIWYDIPGDKFTYASVPSPIISIDKDPDGYGTNYYTAIIDLGNHFTTLSINYIKNFYDSSYNLTLTYNKMYIKKIMLPKDFFIKFLKNVEVKSDGEANKYFAYALQFKNYLVTYSKDWKDVIIIKSRSYRAGEMIPITFDYMKKGLLMYHKGEKKVLFHPEPYDFNDKARTVVMYTSKDPLKDLSLTTFYGGANCFIVDDPKNVKRCSIDVEGDKPSYKINVVEEIPVSKYSDD